MKIKILKVIFKDIKIESRDIPKLRGYFASKHPHYKQLHNHDGDKFIYKIPTIQYRRIRGKATLIGFGEGLEILKKLFFETDKIILGDKIYNSYEKLISLKEYDFGITNSTIKYRFVAPWMALNQINYQKYFSLSNFEKRKEFLEKILIGNLISLSKNLSYSIPNKENISSKISNLQKINIHFKNQEMLCFKCNFRVNFRLPSLLGLGKQVGRGFGEVQHII